jgi:hypothetical protein
MSWINEVRAEMSRLDVSKRNLQKFAFTIGCVLLLITLWLTFKDLSLNIRNFLGIFGILLLLAGLIFPKSLTVIFKIWMILALAIGWWISRFLLVLLFFTVITPMGILARLSGKKFMDIDMRKKKDSYWINKDRKRDINYKKMY